MHNLSSKFIETLTRGGGLQWVQSGTREWLAHLGRTDAALRRDSASVARLGRRDAPDAIWFARELEDIDTTVYTAPLIPSVARMVVPINTKIPAWATSHRWREFERSGEPEQIASYANVVPLVGIRGAEFLRDVKSWALGWGYSMRDIETAARTGVQLDATMGLICRQAMERKMDEILLVGDAASGAVGFLKMPGVPIETLTTKTGGGVAWGPAALGTEIIADFLLLSNRVRAAYGTSNGIKVNFQLASYEYNVLDRPMTGLGAGGATDKTIRGYMMQNYGDRIGAIIESPRCGTAGVGGVSRIMASPAFSSEQEALTYVFGIAPIPFKTYAGQWTELFYKQIAIMSCGGVGVRMPTFFAYGDGAGV